MTLLSPLCQLNGGCMGCCGHDFSSKEGIQKAIKKNTEEFTKQSIKTQSQLLRFRERAFPMDLRNGLCRNLIQKDHHFLCPLHPEQNQGKDFRIGHCDINHFCQTAREFSQWPEHKQQSFLRFIKLKDLDPITYSLSLDNNELLKEFKSLQ